MFCEYNYVWFNTVTIILKYKFKNLLLIFRYDDFGDTARAVQASVETARKEEQAREQEESATAARKDRKAKKMPKSTKDKKGSASGLERRRNSKQDEHGSGSSSPVPMETEDAGPKNATKTAKASKDDNKENQKDRRGSVPREKQGSTEGASNVISAKKPVEKEPLPDFPSLATFKPLTDETVTPTWGNAPSLSSVTSSLSSSSSSSKDSGKKKKKKKKDSGFTIEEPTNDSNISSSAAEVEVDKKIKVSEQPSQPMWNVSSVASTSNSTSVSSTSYPTLSWAATSLSSQSTPKGPTSQSTWGSSVSSAKSQPVTKPTWTEKSSTPDLGNSGDFPTLSSIASLLGGSSGSTSKKQKENRNGNKPTENRSVDKKHSHNDNKPVPAATSWNKAAEPVQSSSAGEVSAKKISKKGQGGTSDSHRPPPGLSLAPSSNDVIHRAPPGFGPGPKVNKPPPGFAVNVPINSVPPDLPLDYIQPDNYTERNFALLEKIKSFLEYDSAKLMVFKTVSGEFRRSKITPVEYYGHCLDLLGDNLQKIFSELVSLLPDVVKQQELLEASNDHKILQKQKKADKVLKISDSKGQSNRKTTASKAWGSTAEHSTCTQCGQVMLKADMEAHLNSHQDFPSLSASVGTKSKSLMAPSSWARIK